MENWIFSIFPNETFVDLGLYQFGWEKCTPSHTFGPAARNHYLFHYVISGTGVLRADDAKGITKVYQIKSGQGFMIFPGQITTFHGNMSGWNSTVFVSKRRLKLPESPWINRFTMPSLRISAKI